MRLKRGVVLALPLLASCAVGPNFAPPKADAPATWFRVPASSAAVVAVASAPSDGAVEEHWWESFGDPELTKLVLRAAARSPDVLIASERIQESRAQLGVAKADAYPQLNGSASYTREYLSPDGVVSLVSGSGTDPATQANGLAGRSGGVPTASASSSIPPFNLFQYGFDASWELDLWGRVRRLTENARAGLEAKKQARRDMLLSTTAEVARDYLQLRGAQETLRITRESLDSFEGTERLTVSLSSAGLSTELDVANARAQAEATAADIPPLEQKQAQLINAIGLLLGEYPGALTAELATPAPLPSAPPRVPLGLPSELARRRPDIREAEAQLHAATASIGAARADFFPKITLSGSVAIQALEFNELGSWAARSYGFGPSLTIPIFDGRRLRGTLELRKAQQREVAVTFRKTVLGAFRDVDDALTGFAAEQRRRDLVAASVTSSRRALELATLRYREGLSDYLEVLTAQRTLLQNQLQLADSTQTVTTNLVALYKALGGGWDSSDAEPEKGR